MPPYARPQSRPQPPAPASTRPTASVAPPVPVAPTDPLLGVIAEAADLARGLLEVMAREADALKTMKTHAPEGFAEAKTRLISAYAVKLEELKDRARTGNAEEALAELRDLNAEVLEAGKRNAALLQGAMEGNRRLIEIVVKAVEQQRAPATVGYGRVGNRAAPPRPADRAAPMMLTRSL